MYVPQGGSGIPWSINEHAALVWDGKPYLPVGVRVDGTAEAVRAAKTAGVEDLLIDVPASGSMWSPTITALKETQQRYLLRISSLAPMARGFVVEPQSYRVAGITTSRPVSVPMTGASGALVVLAAKRDGAVQDSKRVPVINGRLTYNAKVTGPDSEHVLLIYPETSSLEQPDYWEGLDDHRDTLLASLKRYAPGPGLRGIVNPLGRTMTLPGKDLRFVPTSPYFRLEFQKLLKERYRNIETALRSWSMAGSSFSTYSEDNKAVATFADLARLVPLWSGTRGVSQMFDPATNKLYACENRRSTVWRDLADTVNAAGARRFARLADAIHSVTDVPVVQEWAGWAAPYETKTPAIDGIGMRAVGTTPSALSETGSRATSSLLRWSNRGWLPATEVDLGPSKEAPAQLANVLEDLSSLGAKAFFVRAESSEMVKAVVAENAKRSVDPSAANSSPTAVFFPENATSPAVAQRLPGGRWWLPSPADGNRIDLGTQFFAYRLQDGDKNTLVLWSRAPGRVKLSLAKPKDVAFQAADGSDPAPKLVKGGVEVTVTESPLLITNTDEVPIPEPTLTESMRRFAQLTKFNGELRRDLVEESITYRNHLTGFDRSPGGNFNTMQQALNRMYHKLGNFTWVEAEYASDTNFSEALSQPGCSAGGALALKSQIPVEQGFFSEYNLPVRSKDDQEVWIAAKIPAERRGDVQVMVGGQPMLITAEPVSPYGAGYAWYRLGTTRLAGNTTKLRVQVGSALGSEIALDVILLSPSPFQPNGVRLPDPINFGLAPEK
jgi:hypothetical protein